MAIKELKRIEEIMAVVGKGRHVVPELNSAGDGISEGLLAFKGRTEGGVSGRRGAAKEVGGEVNELSVSKMERVSFKKEVDGYQVSMLCKVG